MNYKQKTDSGFTLAELLIVITILAVLGISALIGINPMLQIFKGYDSRRKDDLSKIKTALEAYYSDHDCYPSLDILKNCGSTALEPYLSSIPCDPSTKEPYVTYTGVNESITCPQKYSVYAKLANKFDPQGDQIRYCDDTIVVNSPGAKDGDIIKGCSDKDFSYTYYGCVNQICVIVAENNNPPPTYCTKVYPDDPSCGQELDCNKKVRGKFINYCTIP